MPPDSLVDLFAALRRWRLWTLLGWLDIRQRYARSSLGPFWITLSMGVTVGSLGLVYGTLFGQSMTGYLPLVGTGFVVWGLVSGVLNDACGAYINNANYIRQSDAGLWNYILQVLWRQSIMFAHNFVIVLALLAVFGVDQPGALAWFMPGLFVLMLNLAWMAQMVALASARFRDVPQLVGAVVQILFYVTPLMWRPSMLAKHAWLMTCNPFASLVDLVRSPLLGHPAAPASWMVGLGLALAGWPLALWMYARASGRVAYWV